MTLESVKPTKHEQFNKELKEITTNDNIWNGYLVVNGKGDLEKIGLFRYIFGNDSAKADNIKVAAMNFVIEHQNDIENEEDFTLIMNLAKKSGLINDTDAAKSKEITALIKDVSTRSIEKKNSSPPKPLSNKRVDPNPNIQKKQELADIQQGIFPIDTNKEVPIDTNKEVPITKNEEPNAFANEGQQESDFNEEQTNVKTIQEADATQLPQGQIVQQEIKNTDQSEAQNEKQDTLTQDGNQEPDFNHEEASAQLQDQQVVEPTFIPEMPEKPTVDVSQLKIPESPKGTVASPPTAKQEPADSYEQDPALSQDPAESQQVKEPLVTEMSQVETAAQEKNLEADATALNADLQENITEEEIKNTNQPEAKDEEQDALTQRGQQESVDFGNEEVIADSHRQPVAEPAALVTETTPEAIVDSSQLNIPESAMAVASPPVAFKSYIELMNALKNEPLMEESSSIIDLRTANSKLSLDQIDQAVNQLVMNNFYETLIGKPYVKNETSTFENAIFKILDAVKNNRIDEVDHWLDLIQNPSNTFTVLATAYRLAKALKVSSKQTYGKLYDLKLQATTQKIIIQKLEDRFKNIELQDLTQINLNQLAWEPSKEPYGLIHESFQLATGKQFNKDRADKLDELIYDIFTYTQVGDLEELSYLFAYLKQDDDNNQQVILNQVFSLSSNLLALTTKRLDEIELKITTAPNDDSLIKEKASISKYIKKLNNIQELEEVNKASSLVGKPLTAAHYVKENAGALNELFKKEEATAKRNRTYIKMAALALVTIFGTYKVAKYLTETPPIQDTSIDLDNEKSGDTAPYDWLNASPGNAEDMTISLENEHLAGTQLYEASNIQSKPLTISDTAHWINPENLIPPPPHTPEEMPPSSFTLDMTSTLKKAHLADTWPYKKSDNLEHLSLSHVETPTVLPSIHQSLPSIIKPFPFTVPPSITPTEIPIPTEHSDNLDPAIPPFSTSTEIPILNEHSYSLPTALPEMMLIPVLAVAKFWKNWTQANQEPKPPARPLALTPAKPTLIPANSKQPISQQNIGKISELINLYRLGKTDAAKEQFIQAFKENPQKVLDEVNPDLTSLGAYKELLGHAIKETAANKNISLNLFNDIQKMLKSNGSLSVNLGMDLLEKFTLAQVKTANNEEMLNNILNYTTNLDASPDTSYLAVQIAKHVTGTWNLDNPTPLKKLPGILDKSNSTDKSLLILKGAVLNNITAPNLMGLIEKLSSKKGHTYNKVFQPLIEFCGGNNRVLLTNLKPLFENQSITLYIDLNKLSNKVLSKNNEPLSLPFKEQITSTLAKVLGKADGEPDGEALNEFIALASKNLKPTLQILEQLQKQGFINKQNMKQIFSPKTIDSLTTSSEQVQILKNIYNSLFGGISDWINLYRSGKTDAAKEQFIEAFTENPQDILPEIKPDLSSLEACKGLLGYAINETAKDKKVSQVFFASIQEKLQSKDPLSVNLGMDLLEKFTLAQLKIDNNEEMLTNILNYATTLDASPNTTYLATQISKHVTESWKLTINALDFNNVKLEGAFAENTDPNKSLLMLKGVVLNNISIKDLSILIENLREKETHTYDTVFSPLIQFCHDNNKELFTSLKKEFGQTTIPIYVELATFCDTVLLKDSVPLSLPFEEQVTSTLAKVLGAHTTKAADGETNNAENEFIALASKNLEFTLKILKQLQKQGFINENNLKQIISQKMIESLTTSLHHTLILKNICNSFNSTPFNKMVIDTLFHCSKEDINTALNTISNSVENLLNVEVDDIWMKIQPYAKISPNLLFRHIESKLNMPDSSSVVPENAPIRILHELVCQKYIDETPLEEVRNLICESTPDSAHKETQKILSKLLEDRAPKMKALTQELPLDIKQPVDTKSTVDTEQKNENKPVKVLPQGSSSSSSSDEEPIITVTKKPFPGGSRKSVPINADAPKPDMSTTQEEILETSPKTDEPPIEVGKKTPLETQEPIPINTTSPVTDVISAKLKEDWTNNARNIIFNNLEDIEIIFKELNGVRETKLSDTCINKIIDTAKFLANEQIKRFGTIAVILADCLDKQEDEINSTISDLENLIEKEKADELEKEKTELAAANKLEEKRARLTDEKTVFFEKLAGTDWSTKFQTECTILSDTYEELKKTCLTKDEDICFLDPSFLKGNLFHHALKSFLTLADHYKVSAVSFADKILKQKVINEFTKDEAQEIINLLSGIETGISKNKSITIFNKKSFTEKLTNSKELLTNRIKNIDNKINEQVKAAENKEKIRLQKEMDDALETEKVSFFQKLMDSNKQEEYIGGYKLFSDSYDSLQRAYFKTNNQYLSFFKESFIQGNFFFNVLESLLQLGDFENTTTKFLKDILIKYPKIFNEDELNKLLNLVNKMEEEKTYPVDASGRLLCTVNKKEFDSLLGDSKEILTKQINSAALIAKEIADSKIDKPEVFDKKILSRDELKLVFGKKILELAYLSASNDQGYGKYVQFVGTPGRTSESEYYRGALSLAKEFSKANRVIIFEGLLSSKEISFNLNDLKLFISEQNDLLDDKINLLLSDRVFQVLDKYNNESSFDYKDIVNHWYHLFAKQGADEAANFVGGFLYGKDKPNRVLHCLCKTVLDQIDKIGPESKGFILANNSKEIMAIFQANNSLPDLVKKLEGNDNALLSDLKTMLDTLNPPIS